ncbi:Extended synaptotagmin-1 [Mortierella sp. GBA35]|nr:Extended synaptotagmin-1 [Mortierella sp. AD031]KAF9101678.1 Extended synaptotagmin-1 [Mortierella sp. GBA35]KAG0209886.1 Extended synaptotagmin-1 [Mortierella sp. NVP41]
MTHSLKITVHAAANLEDVERTGKNDPYVQLSVDLNKQFQKTKTIKNAGKEAEWDQTITIAEFDRQENEFLYVEVLDEETLADEPIGFAAIPLNQVFSAQGHAITGRFDLYKVDGKQKGEILLTIAVVSPGQTEPHHNYTEVRGHSQIVSAQQARIRSLKHKETASDAATVAAGAALVGLGAKFLFGGKKAVPLDQ